MTIVILLVGSSCTSEPSLEQASEAATTEFCEAIEASIRALPDESATPENDADDLFNDALRIAPPQLATTAIRRVKQYDISRLPQRRSDS